MRESVYPTWDEISCHSLVKNKKIRKLFCNYAGELNYYYGSVSLYKKEKISWWIEVLTKL